ncbi:uncharacterized protein LOC142226116 [Haematobia irritans]|uniref:uncharacterized protein LOC142226116 n=1 Tax=Haematobia irritans TaxID=7368 RepID=UPI003F500D80
MWPQALQISRDECRGILRRLELESYSQVISVFRAQGGLSDAKAKLLEELRGIFHISNERHRAEARRVANDEQLATIAEAISGPNTWQEWSREGRRPYPMLPRVAPQTALALIANNIAEEAANENLKLPHPAETAAAIKEEQQNAEKEMSTESFERNNYVVTSDPFKVPKIPAGTKKNLKRNNNDQNQSGAAGSGKKRATIESSPQRNHQLANRQQYPHITANSPQPCGSVSAYSGHDNKKQQQQQQNVTQQQNNQHLQKQRYFHHQQQLSKQKMAKKAAAAAAAANNNTTSATNKRQATPAKSGRRANQKLLMEQQQKSLKQLQMPEPQGQSHTLPLGGNTVHIDLTSQPVTSLSQQQNDLHFLSYSTQNVPPQQILMDEQSALASVAHGQLHILPSNSNPQLQQPLPASLITPLAVPSASSTPPQIAASKRDISKNLNKLQQMQQNQHLQQNQISVPHHPASPSYLSSSDMHTSIGSILSSSSSSSSVVKSTEKSLISTTPVQKYIVEERQPNVNTTPGSIVNLQGHTLGTSNAQSGQTPQIMTLPQFSAAATKLRAVNTTLIAPVAKMSPTASKKITNISSPLSPINAGALHELANVASTQSQVLHIVETSQGNSNPTNSASFASSLHTPPAVIQIQNNTQTASGGNVSTSDISSPATSTQSKVLTTTLVPIVLPGSSGSFPNPVGSSPINNSQIVIGSSIGGNGNVGVTSIAPLSSSSSTVTTTSGSTTIIKNLPPNLVLNANTNTMTPVTVTGTIFSTLGAGATVFRKPQNLIKTPLTTVTSTSKSQTSVSGAAHIISNVKVSPKNITTSAATASICTPSTIFKNIVASTSAIMRTNVKICQSANGKVMITPADGSKLKLNTSTLPHKILAANTATSGTSSSVGGSGGGQRIAIQKVQIIPAPMGSPVGTANMHSTGTTTNTKPTTLTGKSNMIFMPSSATSNVRPVTLSKTSNNILIKSSTNAQLQSSSSDNNTAKGNIVVLGPSSSIQSQNAPLKVTLGQKYDMSNSFINEDAPLDILNMPIVMDAGVGGSPAETVTVLPGNIIESNNCTTNSADTPIIVEQNPQSSSASAPQTVILGATDWEMELDQAITTAANNNSALQYQKSSSTNRKKRNISTSSSSSSISMSSSPTTSGNKQKRLNTDLVSIELKTNRQATSQEPNSNNIIVVDSFDDVIVEEHEDDLQSSNMEHISVESETTNRQSEDQPKILDMQIYQQHDGVDGNKSHIAIAGSQQSENIILEGQASENAQQQLESTNVEHQPQERQRRQHAECEDDAGFDETIVSEIDENTAIEYIEEDGVVVSTSTSTLTTTSTTVTVAGKDMSPSESTILTKALIGGTNVASNTSSNSNNLDIESASTTKSSSTKEGKTAISATQQKQETNANNSGT